MFKMIRDDGTPFCTADIDFGESGWSCDRPEGHSGPHCDTSGHLWLLDADETGDMPDDVESHWGEREPTVTEADDA